MLSTMRKGASGFLAKAMLMLLVVMFGVWGVGDMLRQHSGSLAKVGKMTISPVEFDMRLRNMQRTMGNLPPEFTSSPQFKQQVMQGIVQQALLLQESQREGITLDDKTLAKLVGQAPQFRSATGTFDRDAFNAFLREQQMTEASFLSDLRRDTAATTLLESISLPKALGFPTLAKALTQAQGQVRSAELYVIPAVDMSAIGEPDEKTLKSFYNEVKEQYLSPEYRTIDFVALPREAVESSIRANLTEADIEDRYALEKAQLASPEKRNVTQLLFNEEAEAKDAAEALKAGQSLGEVKARFKPQVTEMKDIGKNALPAEAAASVFALKEGEISAPVKTDFGWHVFKQNSIVASKAPSLAESKEKITHLLVAERGEEELGNLSGQLEDALAAGDDVTKAAKALKLDARSGTLEAFDKDGKNAQGQGMKADKVAAAVLAKGFSLDEGQSSGFEPAQEEYVAVFTREVTPQAPKEFDTVKAELRKRYFEEERNIRTAKRAQDVVAKLMQAKDANIVVRDEKLMRRSVSGITLGQAMSTQKEENSMPPMLARNLFDAKLDSFTPPARLANGNWVIAKVSSIQQSVQEPSADTELSQEQRQALADAVYSDYLQHLVSKYPVKINEAMLKGNDQQP